ncbi:hypothetical protein BKG77_05180 [Mycobacteroides chelonae]|nr:hypothetical protein BKG77_05180 [Mycobacteroides chelonae]
MALFAEFDASSRINSTTFSTVLQAFLTCYLPPEAWPILEDGFPIEQRSTVAVLSMLKVHRSSQMAVDKKASLFLRPFDPTKDPDGPYLLGYLSVKSLWKTASRRVFRLLSEPDLFMMYLRSYIFADAGLVCALLEPCRNPQELAERLTRYISKRIVELDNLTTSDVLEFEEYVEGIRTHPEAVRFDGTPGIQNSPKLIRRAQELSEELAASWEYTRVNASKPAIAELMNDILNQRFFANVVRSDVHIELDESGGMLKVFFEGQLVLVSTVDNVLPSVTTLASLNGPATLEVSLNMSDFARAAIIARDELPLVVIPLSISESMIEFREHVGRRYRDQRKLAMYEDFLRRNVDEHFRNPELAIIRIVDEIERLVLPLWNDIAFRYARDYDAIDRCSLLMAEGGLRGLAIPSGLIRQLAVIGLTQSHRTDSANMRDEFDRYGWNLEFSINQFDEIFQKYGFPPRIVDSGNSIFSYI